MTSKKRTGKIGPIRVSRTSDGAGLSWNTVDFSSRKEEIELLVVKLFSEALQRAGVRPFTYRQNEQSDFDFTLQFAETKTYLELREIHYFDIEGGGVAATGSPYESRRTVISDFAYAMQIVRAVHRKSYKYGSARKIPIDLLLYITHWRFSPSELVIRLAQHFLLEAPPIFSHVFFVRIRDDAEAEPRVLFPSINPLEGRAPEEFVNSEYIKMDPGKARLIPSTDVGKIGF